MLDLFSVTGSFSRPFVDQGWEVVTIDNNPRFRPTICEDILEWNYHEFLPKFFNVVVSSPLCQDFSIANKHKPKGFHAGDCHVLQTLRIIEYFQPTVWLLENPRSGDLVNRPYMRQIPYADFDYCEFSAWGYKKPTRMWGSPQILNVKSVTCTGACQNMAQPCDGQKPHHKQWLGGYGHQPNQIAKYRIPEELVKYLICNLGVEEMRRAAANRGPAASPAAYNVWPVEVRREADQHGEPSPLHQSRTTRSRHPHATPPGIPEMHPTEPMEVKADEPSMVLHGPEVATSSNPPRPMFQFKHMMQPREAPIPPPEVREPHAAEDAQPGPEEEVETEPSEDMRAHLPDIASDPGQIFDESWDQWYEKCPKFKDAWQKVHDPEVEWPEGYQLLEEKLYWGTKLCVPRGLTRNVVRAHHWAAGHIGSWRLMSQMARFYNWASEARARGYSRQIQQKCCLCQAIEHPHTLLKLRQDPIPVPPYLMDSVAVDVFTMPLVVHNGKQYDCFVACVDRMSGWIVTVAMQRKGLRADVVAKKMFSKAWSLFGVPRVVTSDQGPQFASAWWQTMCGCLGIRQAFAQAYQSQANGRAEAAGRELQRKLRLLRDQLPDLSWVEALPIAVAHIHNSPGEAGLSPYQIITGRTRNLPGIPFPVNREAQDALDFVQKQKDTDEKVAQILNEKHAKNTENLNANRPEPPPFGIGDWVWFRRPPSLTADKSLPRWVGPCPVTARMGLRSYKIEIKPGYFQSAHRSQLKPYHVDSPEGENFPLHYFRLSPQDAIAEDMYKVEKVLKHKMTPKGPKFLTKWEGYQACDATWEPINHFFHSYASPFVAYCRRHGLALDLLQYLSDKPIERGGG